MGANASSSYGALVAPSAALPAPTDVLSDLPAGVVVKSSLGGGRFLKTVLCAHESGSLIVVKVFFVRGEVRRRDVDAALATLAAQTAALASPPLPSPHVAPAARVHRTERAIFLMRQHVHTTLKERMASAVALAPIEKLFIAYQLLLALSQCHSRGVLHGDLTPSNVLLTSWGWLLLADFATAYKPTCLPADNPSQFSFFYDTDTSRACHTAPERFVDDAAAVAAGGCCSAASDIFSAGCVLAALLSSDGQPLFDLAALMTWRGGGADPRGRALAAIEATPGLGAAAAQLVGSMTEREPGRRLSAAEYLAGWEGLLWAPYFALVRDASAAALAATDADSRSEALAAALPGLCLAVINEEARPARQRRAAAAAHAVRGAGSGAVFAAASAAARECARGDPSLQRPLPGASLLAQLACAALLSAQRRGSKRRALRSLLHLAAPLVSSAERASRLLPHALLLAQDRAPPMRAAACAAAAELLGLSPFGVDERAAAAHITVEEEEEEEEEEQEEGMPPPEAPPAPDSRAGGEAALSFLREVIHFAAPALVRAPGDAEESVRAAAAAALPRLASLAARALQRAAWASSEDVPSQPPAEAASGGLSLATVTAASASGARQGALISMPAYDAFRASLHALMRESLADPMRSGGAPGQQIATPASGGSSAAAAAVLSAASLAGAPFLSQAGGAEALLPAALSCLNDRQWRARRAAYRSAPALASAMGGSATCAALASAAENGLSDSHVSVAAAAGLALARLLRSGGAASPAARRACLSAAAAAAPLLRHPAKSLRGSAARVVAAAANALGQLDAAALLAPQLAPGLGLSNRAARALLQPGCLPLTVLHAAPPPLSWERYRALGESVAGGAVEGEGDEMKEVKGAEGDAAAAAAAASEPSLVALGEHARTTMRKRQQLRAEAAVEVGLAAPPPAPSSLSPSRGAAQPSAAALAQAAAAAAQAQAPPLYATQRGLDGQLGVTVRVTPQLSSSTGLAGGASRRLDSQNSIGSSGAAAAAAAAASASAVAAAVAAATGAPLPWRGPGPTAAVGAAGLEATGNGPLGRIWRPACVLVSHGTEHTRSVNALSSSPQDSSSPPWVLSVSDDGTAKLWDASASGLGLGPVTSSQQTPPTAIGRSVATFGGGQGRLTCCTALGADRAATGSEMGVVSVWKLEKPRSGAAAQGFCGASSVRSLVDGGGSASGRASAITCLAASASVGETLLLGGSACGGVCGWDLRAGGTAWRLEWRSAESGAPTCMLLESGSAAAWLCLGSSRGELSFWDLRYRVPLSRWRHPLRLPLRALAPAPACPRTGGARVWLSAGDRGELACIDASNAGVNQLLRLRPAGDGAVGDEPETLGGGGGGNGSNVWAGLRTRALLATGGGSLVTASDEGVLRQWEPPPRGVPAALRVPACRLLCGPAEARQHTGGPPVAGQWRGVSVLQQRLGAPGEAGGPAVGSAAPGYGRMGACEAHADAITALASVGPCPGSPDRLLFSASRDGVVKAWL